jgi:nucleoside-diphosphate-sugar epimerase
VSGTTARVLVTGGAGTIGNAVVRRLERERDLAVRIVDYRLGGGQEHEGREAFEADLRDLESARRALAGCKHVVHLAAIVGGIANFHKLPYTLLEANNALYNSLFRAAIEARVERFVYVSSSMAFERALEFPTTEESLERTLPPRSSYGFSKLTGEYYCRAAHDEFGLPYSIVRPFNAYGPGELPGDEPGIAHLVPDLIERCLRGERPLQIFGSGEQTRTLTHVDDIADGIAAALSHPAALGEDFNVSANEELTVREIAAIVWEACGNDPAELELRHLPSFEVDVQRRWPSTEKARRLLGWEARIGVREGIADTVRWFRSRASEAGPAAPRR